MRRLRAISPVFWNPRNSRRVAFSYLNLELTACILVGLVLAVGLVVTEELLVDALAVAAGQLALGAHGFVGLEPGQHLAWFCGGKPGRSVSVASTWSWLEACRTSW